jgi:hypothetical protein
MLRQQIAKAPDDIRQGMLMDELAKVELDRARRAHTVLAYRRFLAEFPSGDEAATARSLLEELRFQETEHVGTHEAWEAFLEEHPRGKRATEAREHLGTLEFATALTSNDLSLVRHTLARFPEQLQRENLVLHEDDLAWAAAARSDLAAVDTYLTDHPGGLHRAQAAQRRDEMEQTEIYESDDLSRARGRAAAADATELRRSTVLALELHRALETLDIDAVRGVAATNPTEPRLIELRDQARRFIDSWTTRPPAPEVLSAIDAARPGRGLRAHAESLAHIGVGDPVEQVAALRELAEWGQRDDIDVVLKALSSRYLAVRLAAIEALKSYASSLKPAIWAVLARVREQDALSRPTNDSWLRAAVLREVAGRGDDAAVAWREYLRVASDDLVARARLFALEQSTGDLAPAATARDLAKAAIAFADGRIPAAVDARQRSDAPGPNEGSVVGLPVELSLARQICSATGLASQASQLLGRLVAGVAPSERELIQLAKTDTDNAIRRLQAKQLELEQGLVRAGVRFPACGADLAASTIVASRIARSRAIEILGKSHDDRLVPFLTALSFTPSSEVRTAARTAIASIMGKLTTPASR